MTAPENLGLETLPGRLVRTGAVLTASGATLAIAAAGWRFSVSLTVTALVVIVHVLWLDRLLATVLTGQTPRFRRRDSLKLFGNILLLTALVATAYLWSGFSPAGSAVGVTLAVATVAIEGFRTISNEV